MPRHKRTPAKQPTARTETQFQISQHVQERTLSAYVNHAGVQCRGGPGLDDVTISFWQIPAHMMDADRSDAPAFLLGSFVMTRDFAKRFLHTAAEQLNMELTEKGETDDGE